MKTFALTVGLFLTQFTFGQKVYSESEVDKMAIYPTCERAKETAKCFSQKLTLAISNEFINNIENFDKGIFDGRVNFTINEDGTITNISTQGDDKDFRDQATKSTQTVFAKNNLITPAQVNGQNVSMNYSIPIRLHID